VFLDVVNAGTTTYSDDSTEAASGASYEYSITAMADGIESASSATDTGYAGDQTIVSISFLNPADPGITLTAPDIEIARGDSVTVTAPAGYTAYTWYLGLEAESAAVTPDSANSATVDTTELTPGVHTLGVVIQDGEDFYSAELTLTVTS
jgi:hypothetical protein